MRYTKDRKSVGCKYCDNGNFVKMRTEKDVIVAALD
jgi:hypothetical protein